MLSDHCDKMITDIQKLIDDLKQVEKDNKECSNQKTSTEKET